MVYWQCERLVEYSRMANTEWLAEFTQVGLTPKGAVPSGVKKIFQVQVEFIDSMTFL